ncbi:hypothetical protein ABK040_009058 [Willaertia magna]
MYRKGIINLIKTKTTKTTTIKHLLFNNNYIHNKQQQQHYSIFSDIKNKFISKYINNIISNHTINNNNQIKIPGLVSTSSNSIIFSSDIEINKEIENNKLANLIKESILKDKENLNISSNFNEIELELKEISKDILESVKSDHPVLDTAAKYFFNTPGKLFRPMLVLLCGKLASTNINNNNLTNMDSILKKQYKLAEITELIHVASLIHDDIIDEADTRRGIVALNKFIGNKIAVLAGDFLLARASINLARIGNLEVIDLISTVIEHLSYGEVLQMAGKGKFDFDYYMKTIFFKTSSLIANSCKGSAILSGITNIELINACYDFGKHLGIAYQLIDDALDYVQSSEELGKPSQGADMKLGLTTCPILFATKHFPNEMIPIVERKFTGEKDRELVLKYVHESNAIQLTRDLADTHMKLAYDAVMKFNPSSTRSTLLELLYKILIRNK